MAITTNDLKNGMTLNLSEGLFTIVDFQHVKPGKGGAFVRTTLKNARTGAVVDRTFRAGEKVDQAVIDKREMQFLYRDGSDFVFMDNATYDQRNVGPSALGDAASFIVDGSLVVLQLYGDEIVGVDLPAAVELAVRQTEPGIQGDRVSGARKPATLETGLVVQVPLFVNEGDKLKVDTRSGEYITARSAGHETLQGRREARERALELLYEAETKDTTCTAIVDALPVAPDPYATAIAKGVDEDRVAIDALIRDHAKGWTLERMPAVDRAVLRMATYELLHCPDVPVAVAISEAVELAEQFSTDESGRFVNGLLGAVAKQTRPDD